MDAMTSTTESQRVIRPAAVIAGRLARAMLAWLENNEVTVGGCWAYDVRCVQRFSGPWDGPSGMRGSAVLLGSIHMTWDRYDATIYRANITEEGLRRGLTVDELCDSLLVHVGLTLATCPRAELVDAPRPDPFKAFLPHPRPGV